MRIILKVMLLAVAMATASTLARAEAVRPGPQHAYADSEKQPLRYTNSSVVFCNGDICAEARMSTLRSAYPTLFSTQKEYEQRSGLKYNVPITSLPYWCTRYSGPSGVIRNRRQTSQCPLAGDGDKCCQTFRYATWYTELQNINGKTCYIIHLPVFVMYQFTTTGVCRNGSCQQCEIQYTDQTMLSWCPGQHFGLSFELFHIPTYCICVQ